MLILFRKEKRPQKGGEGKKKIEGNRRVKKINLLNQLIERAKTDEQGSKIENRLVIIFRRGCERVMGGSKKGERGERGNKLKYKQRENRRW